MTDSPDYRLYLTKCFQELNGKLDTIVDQTTKTNNKVEKLEDKSNDRQIVIDDFRHLEREFDCVKKKVNKIDKDLLEVWFFKKYPKIFVTILVIAVIATLILVRTKLNTVKAMVTDLKEQVDIINVPMYTRGGDVQFIPSIKVYDSLYKDNNIKN